MRVDEVSSFRDNAGRVYSENGVLYREVSHPYREHWDKLQASGFLDALIADELLTPHQARSPREGQLALLEPERIPFISYPYEWSFSQLKDAALCTLEIQKRALDRGLILKDASAYNIQFRKGRPILIDTLSFEIYREGEPWQAYRQFCRHFLAPLALMAYIGPEALLMLRDHIDGIPLGWTSKALPGSTKFKAGLTLHLHMHAKSEAKSGEASGGAKAKVSETGMRGLMDSLTSTIQGLSWKPEGTVWADYYAETNYTDAAMAEKHRLVADFLNGVPEPLKCVWDLGANTGEFSKIAAGAAGQVVAFDIDPAAVEKHYLAVRANGVPNVLPLVQDLTNPSPGLGWAGKERASLPERSNADVLLALALVHHLAIGNNVPLPKVFEYFADLAPWLIVEFVPKEDSQTQRLLAAKPDIFDSYTEAGFESALQIRYRQARKQKIEGTRRTLYLLERKA